MFVVFLVPAVTERAHVWWLVGMKMVWCLLMLENKLFDVCGSLVGKIGNVRCLLRRIGLYCLY